MLNLVGLAFEKVLNHPKLYSEFKKIIGEIELERIVGEYVFYLNFKKITHNDFILLEEYPELSKAYWIIYFRKHDNESLQLIWEKKLYNWAKFIKENILLIPNPLQIYHYPIPYQQICILLSEDKIERLLPAMDMASIENFKVSCFLGFKKVSRFLYRKMVVYESYKFISVDAPKALLVGQEYYLKSNPNKDITDFWEFLGIDNTPCENLLA